VHRFMPSSNFCNWQIVLQKSKIERHRKFREGRFLDGSAEGPWSFLCETMWSLTSPRTNASAILKNFVSQPKKTFATQSARNGPDPCATGNRGFGCRPLDF